MEQCPANIVVQDLSRSPILVRDSDSEGVVPGHRERSKECMEVVEDVVTAAGSRVLHELRAPVAFKDLLETNFLHDQADWLPNLCEVVNRHCVVDYEVSSRGNHGWEYKPGAIAQRDPHARQLQCLDVFRLPWPAAHANLLGTHQRVDHSALPNVRISDESHCASPKNAVRALCLGGGSRGQTRDQLVQEVVAIDNVDVGVRQDTQRWCCGVVLCIGRLLGLGGNHLSGVGSFVAFGSGIAAISVEVVVQPRHRHRSGVVDLILCGTCTRQLCLFRELVECGEEEHVDVVRRVVFRPLPALIRRKKVRLVNKKHHAFPFVHLLYIAAEVPAMVKVWITGVQDLHEQIAPLDGAPQLPPKVEVALVWREVKALLLGGAGEFPAPFGECLALQDGKPLRRHAFGPKRASWYRHELALLGRDLFSLADRLCRNQCRPLDELVLANFLCVLLLSEFHRRDEFLERALFEYGCRAWTLQDRAESLRLGSQPLGLLLPILRDCFPQSASGLLSRHRERRESLLH
mmetsp:Transcript_33156/g.91369  ORF Transcript_33156/g.91369 Transcript_33156/m.91369 type:complete len:518 (+) Transcript_33156:339-1892(+)